MSLLTWSDNAERRMLMLKQIRSPSVMGEMGPRKASFSCRRCTREQQKWSFTEGPQPDENSYQGTYHREKETLLSSLFKRDPMLVLVFKIVFLQRQVLRFASCQLPAWLRPCLLSTQHCQRHSSISESSYKQAPRWDLKRSLSGFYQWNSSTG